MEQPEWQPSGSWFSDPKTWVMKAPLSPKPCSNPYIESWKESSKGTSLLWLGAPEFVQTVILLASSWCRLCAIVWRLLLRSASTQSPEHRGLNNCNKALWYLLRDNKQRSNKTNNFMSKQNSKARCTSYVAWSEKGGPRYNPLLLILQLIGEDATINLLRKRKNTRRTHIQNFGRPAQRCPLIEIWTKQSHTKPLSQGSKYQIIIYSPKYSNLDNYYPQPKYLIIGSYGALGLQRKGRSSRKTLINTKRQIEQDVNTVASINPALAIRRNTP